MKYTIIVPVYNRPKEAEDLLESLVAQSYRDFDIILVEDGSAEDCREVVEAYRDRLDIHYFYKVNSGPGDSRNFGMSKATGDYFLFFDSDCVIPPDYLQTVDDYLKDHPLDAYGGPDAAHESFSDVQKAINYAMTSFFTTGGIRGRKKQLDKFQPRSFNMGFRKEVYEKVGGFADINPGEDPDLSYRIMKAGFRTGLIPEAYVFHKRRIDFSKFKRQVVRFGVARTILMKWHPGTGKMVYWLPTLFFLGTYLLLLLAIFIHWAMLMPLVLFALIIFTDAFFKTGNLRIASLAVYASFIQLHMYGFGFLMGMTSIHFHGKDEREAFPRMFFTPPDRIIDTKAKSKT